MERNPFFLRLCALIVFKILFSFADVFSDLSTGLELGGLDPPMKYVMQPITNYLNGYTRQSIADENDKIINKQLNSLENLNVQFCKELSTLALELKTRQSKN